MLCDNCHDNEAIISYTKMTGDHVEAIHLCGRCAEEKMKAEFPFAGGSAQVESFLRELFKLSGKSAGDFDKTCTHCGATFSDLEHNALGCEHCYDTFEKELTSMLESEKYSSHHMGKVPASAGEDLVRQRDIRELERQLREAVATEAYEEAAVIRDQLKAKKADYGTEH
ncbi:UvrB/UvrC motif-containing protein [Peptoniphilus equinus]|uniref:UvrB/UvrC motif-containing protein n=1 Tax=Peptoniphilus equinus TaxID=3016343 RepID=A0ABY7QRQ8_9FIRM|nr:UvrB/UvrC motif-containing protein [Peptoniphilus equinus]WBW49474.1 UvrB/UvrC motif-containing protein [Peptoniphilus equinus]